MKKIKSLKTIFLNKLKKNNVKFILNGKDSVDNNINITFPDTDGDFLFSKLDNISKEVISNSSKDKLDDDLTVLIIGK